MIRFAIATLLLSASTACAGMQVRTFPVPAARSAPVVSFYVSSTLPAVEPSAVQVVSEAELAGLDEEAILVGKVKVRDVVQRCIDGYGCKRWPDRNVVPDVISKAAPLGGNLVVLGGLDVNSEPLRAKRRCSTSPFRHRDTSVLGRDIWGTTTRTYSWECSYYEGEELVRLVEAEVYRRVDPTERRALQRRVALQKLFGPRSNDEGRIAVFRELPEIAREEVNGETDGVSNDYRGSVLEQFVRRSYAGPEVLRAALEAGRFRFQGKDRHTGAMLLRSLINGFTRVPSWYFPPSFQERRRWVQRSVAKLQVVLEAGVDPNVLNCAHDGRLTPIASLAVETNGFAPYGVQAVDLLFAHGYRYAPPDSPFALRRAARAVRSRLEANQGPRRCEPWMLPPE